MFGGTVTFGATESEKRYQQTNISNLIIRSDNWSLCYMITKMQINICMLIKVAPAFINKVFLK